ncbi:hypothetical protein F8M41_010299 [Gigaspora margarita]|uniref:Uncharacterized protein n=1 Tax=Gigaspora margarita TaxID=4874 RepID=A0A8H4EQB7_GIGMA|nr:hypothetical protein F8M41_010299 [Gigaspora margarita]
MYSRENNNNLVFFFGGDNNSFTHKYDISKQQWADVTNGENQPTGRSDISCTKFINRLIAIFASYFEREDDIKNDLWIFNLLVLTWRLNKAPNASPDIQSYHAITLSDNTMYFGGVFSDNETFLLLNNVMLYFNRIDLLVFIH